jgi:hypothetical protein
MLNACKLVADIERASRWFPVADTFVDSYGCPSCSEYRISYGSALRAVGPTVRELASGLQITHGASPELHGAGGAGEPDPEAAAGRCRPVGSREHVGGPGPAVRPGQGALSAWRADAQLVL